MQNTERFDRTNSFNAMMRSCRFGMEELADKAACCDSWQDKVLYYSTLNGYLFGFFSSVDNQRAKEIFNENQRFINSIEERGVHSCESTCKFQELDSYLYDAYGDLIENFVAAHERDVRIDEALDYIREHLDSDLRTDQLAEMVHMSRSHFCRLFRQQTGDCLKCHIRNLRMEKAKKLLENPNNSIESVSWQCGFNSHAYFSATFRKYTNMTPCHYRAMSAASSFLKLKEA